MVEKDNTNKIIIFKTEDERISGDVRFDDETGWLSQDQMSQFYAEKELEESVSMRKYGISEFSAKPTNYYIVEAIAKLTEFCKRLSIQNHFQSLGMITPLVCKSRITIEVNFLAPIALR